MGWSDSEDDDDVEYDMDAIMKENEKQRRRDEGLPSESEEDESEEEEVIRKPAPKQQPKPEVYVPLADPEAEKARQKKMQQDADMNAAASLFGAQFMKKDTDDADEAAKRKAEEEKKAAEEAAKKTKVLVKDEFMDEEIKTGAQFEEMLEKVATKVCEKSFKGGQARFLHDILRNVVNKLPTDELVSLEKKCQRWIKEKNVAATEKREKEQKGNATATKNTKFDYKDELNCVYGDEWDEGEWDEEDWDEGEWAKGDWK